MAKDATIFTDFLTALGVPHTRCYSDSCFNRMTFKSLFGLSHLLKDYGIPNQGWKLDDKEEVKKISPPFLAQLKDGKFVIVSACDATAGEVTLSVSGKRVTEPTDDFIKDFIGTVLTAYPQEHSSEPHFSQHAVNELVCRASKYVLMIAALGVFAYFFVTRGVYSRLSTILITLFDLFGLWLSFMLMQKSLGIHTATSERVCGVLERGGCDVITTSKASKLFGVFSWSEIGFAYFGVSLISLLTFPHIWPALALCNLCCLPYTIWSITYQRFIAHHWCTLCVGVQATLWALFFCYLCGGMIGEILPLKLDYFVLIGVYVVVVLAMHYLLNAIKIIPQPETSGQ